MKSNARKYLLSYLVFLLLGLSLLAGIVMYVDPFFHYHAPHVEHFFYPLNNERSQNQGLVRHFDYDTLVTGTSMTENFACSQIDRLFHAKSIKVPFSGGRFKEVDQHLQVALACQPKLKRIIRCLDSYCLNLDKDNVQTELGTFPTYLYDRNPFNDVYYLFNRDVLYRRILPMLLGHLRGNPPGISDFDHYAYWMPGTHYGPAFVLGDRKSFHSPSVEEKLSEEDLQTIRDNLEQNVLATVRSHPDVEFDCFFPPYSAAYWGGEWEKGLLAKDAETFRYSMELLLQEPNLHLYFWDTQTEIGTNLNNYKDTTHYGEWINRWMLEEMAQQQGRVTPENYRKRVDDFYRFYSDYNYSQLFQQEDLPDPDPLLK